MDERKHILARNKAIAGGMMVVAALLFVVARSQKGGGIWDWVAAFSEAAMVGALADWFAVVALFRHPLGVPIPHTAIIPNKKEAIAESLADFIRDKFLATETLVLKLHELNPGQRFAAYLASRKNADELAGILTRLFSDSLDFIEDDRVQKILRSAVGNRIDKFDLAGSAGLLLDTLRTDNRHQVVLDDLLNRLALYLATAEAQEKLANTIDTWVSTEYPLLSKFIPNRDQFAKGAGEKIARKINGFIQEVNADSSHELRQRFDVKVTEFSTKLKYDPKLRAGIDAIKMEAVNNTHLSGYVQNLCGDLKTWLSNDLDRPHSSIRKKLSEAAVGLGGTLSKNRELIDSINEHLETLVRHYADSMRSGITRHVAGTVKQWEDADFVNEIELSIGSDLQFIRMNGTLVGGCIGLLLHCVTLLLR